MKSWDTIFSSSFVRHCEDLLNKTDMSLRVENTTGTMYGILISLREQNGMQLLFKEFISNIQVCALSPQDIQTVIKNFIVESARKRNHYLFSARADSKRRSERWWR